MEKPLAASAELASPDAVNDAAAGARATSRARPARRGADDDHAAAGTEHPHQLADGRDADPRAAIGPRRPAVSSTTARSKAPAFEGQGEPAGDFDLDEHAGLLGALARPRRRRARPARPPRPVRTGRPSRPPPPGVRRERSRRATRSPIFTPVMPTTSRYGFARRVNGFRNMRDSAQSAVAVAVSSRQSVIRQLADCRRLTADCRLPTADCRLLTVI